MNLIENIKNDLEHMLELWVHSSLILTFVSRLILDMVHKPGFCFYGCKNDVMAIMSFKAQTTENQIKKKLYSLKFVALYIMTIKL